MRLLNIGKYILCIVILKLFYVIVCYTQLWKILFDYEEIDYNNYELMKEEYNRIGFGEQGRPVIISSENLNDIKDLYFTNGFQAGISDIISINRSLGEHRHPHCLNKTYLYLLPNVSIVIPFHEEHLSTLLRTIHSALNRSPQYLIKEIILVDDYSTKPSLKKPLEDYVSIHYPNRVRIIRNVKREGLIRTRNNGAKVAKGEVLVFLDAHCECNHNWLAPLIDPIARNYKTVTCPFIDGIEADTFKYTHQDEGARGSFNWDMQYKRLPRLPEDKDHPVEPFDSPVMAGGLFAISTKWFWELGGYDAGLDFWGGEQYELSFKVWQCGGRLIDIPCSRIGHIYRTYSPFRHPSNVDQKFGIRNTKRVAEVWMDEYKHFVYMRKPPGHYDNVDSRDLSERKAIRKHLSCKSFHWYMTNIAFDLVKNFPVIEPGLMAEGRIRSIIGFCLTSQNDSITIKHCSKLNQHQIFHYTFREEFISVGSPNKCLDVPNGTRVSLYGCHQGRGNQMWTYNIEKKQIFHSSKNCLAINSNISQAVIGVCNVIDTKQQWFLDNMNISLISDPLHGLPS